jgi:D-glycero-alpha-D-manno-heptose 1-phosphate guanylyltransferase
MDIIILCGGLGTRLKNFSKGIPKTLIPIKKNVMFLDILLRRIKKISSGKIFLSLFYKPNLFVEFLTKKNLNIDYVIEKKKLDTGGAIKNIINKKKISKSFIVLNGDTLLFNYDLKQLFKFYFLNKKSTVLTCKIKKNTRYGNIVIDKNNEIISFSEKKNNTNAIVNMGFYIFNKKDFCMKKHVFSLEKELLPKMVKEKKLMAFLTKKKFIDIGIPKDLNALKKYYSSKVDDKFSIY